jgi:splicing factor 3B subunit 1
MRDREEGKEKADLDRTPPAAEVEEAAKELVAMTGSKRKRRWDSEDSAEKENQDVNTESTGEWSSKALEEAAPKKRRSRWDALLLISLWQKPPNALVGIKPPSRQKLRCP